MLFNAVNLSFINIWHVLFSIIFIIAIECPNGCGEGECKMVNGSPQCACPSNFRGESCQIRMYIYYIIAWLIMCIIPIKNMIFCTKSNKFSRPGDHFYKRVFVTCTKDSLPNVISFSCDYSCVCFLLSQWWHLCGQRRQYLLCLWSFIHRPSLWN